MASNITLDELLNPPQDPNSVQRPERTEQEKQEFVDPSRRGLPPPEVDPNSAFGKLLREGIRTTYERQRAGGRHEGFGSSVTDLLGGVQSGLTKLTLAPFDFIANTIMGLPKEEQDMFSRALQAGEYENVSKILGSIPYGKGEYVGRSTTAPGRVGEFIGEGMGFGVAASGLMQSLVKKYGGPSKQFLLDKMGKIATERAGNKTPGPVRNTVDALRLAGADMMDMYNKNPQKQAGIDVVAGGGIAGGMQTLEEIFPGYGATIFLTPIASYAIAREAAPALGSRIFKGFTNLYEKYTDISPVGRIVKEGVKKAKGEKTYLTEDLLPENLRGTAEGRKILKEMENYTAQLQETEKIQKRIADVLGDDEIINLTPTERIFSATDEYSEELIASQTQAQLAFNANAVRARREVIAKNLSRLIAFENRLSERGLFDPDKETPAFVYDRLKNAWTAAKSSIETDWRNTEALIDQINPARKVLGSGNATTISIEVYDPKAQKMVTKNVPVISMLSDEAKREGGNYIRNAYISRRQLVEKDIEEFGKSLGIFEANPSMNLTTFQSKLRDSLGIVGAPLTEKQLPRVIKDILNSKEPRFTFKDWWGQRRVVGAQLAIEKDSFKKQALMNYKKMLDDTLHGTSGWAKNIKGVKAFSDKYRTDVVVPYENATLNKVGQQSKGSAREQPLYQLNEEEIYYSFLKQGIKSRSNAQAFMNMFGDDPKALLYLRNAIIDDIATSPQKKITKTSSEGDVFYFDPEKIRAKYKDSAEVFTVPSFEDGNTLVTVREMIDDIASLNEGLLARQQELFNRQRMYDNTVLNNFFSKNLSKIDLEIGDSDVKTLDTLLDSVFGLKGLKAGKEVEALVSQEKTMPTKLGFGTQKEYTTESTTAAKKAAESQVMTATIGEESGAAQQLLRFVDDQVKTLNKQEAGSGDQFKEAFNKKIFERILDNTRVVPKEFGKDSQIAVIQNSESLATAIKNNEKLFEKLLGKQHLEDLIVINEATARIMATGIPEVSAVDIGSFGKAFKELTGMTTQGYSARFINMAEKRVSPRTTVIYLLTQLQKQKAMGNFNKIMEQAMTDPKVAKVLSMKGSGIGTLSRGQGEMLRKILFRLGIADPTVSGVGISPLEGRRKQERGELTIPLNNSQSEPEPVKPEPVELKPVADAPILRRQPMPVASAPVATNKNTYASLFPQGTLGQEIANRSKGGIGSLA